MNQQKIKISDIIVPPRFREIKEDYLVNELMPSMKEYGLVQPVVIDQHRNLIAGGHRLESAKRLGWTDISFSYFETLDETQRRELELLENVKRLDFTWQERCLAVYEIHEMKKRKSALEGERWGMQETGVLIGMTNAHVHHLTTIAKLLLSSKDHPAWQCESMARAWKDCVLRVMIERGEAELAKRHVENAQSSNDQWIEDLADVPEEFIDMGITAPPVEGTPVADEVKAAAKVRYESNPLNPPDSFEGYWEDYCRKLKERQTTINLSKRLIHGDCIAFMNFMPGVFDHVITDIPYGIDMDMLNQQNPHGGMRDIDTVEEEHTVEGNMDLMSKFFPSAFGTLKDVGFLVTWCDQMQWQYMYDLATKAGFKVQRWPITWIKTHRCMNQSAQYNFTKTTEIAMVCRKGNAVLMKPAGQCTVAASNEEVRKLVDHPFAKPFEVWDFITDYICMPGQSVLEPFAGKGSGVLAMLRKQLNVTAVEIDDAHYNALLENVKRWYLSMNSELKFV